MALCFQGCQRLQLVEANSIRLERRQLRHRLPVKGAHLLLIKIWTTVNVVRIHSFNQDLMVQHRISFVAHLSSLNRIFTHLWPGHGTSVLIIPCNMWRSRYHSNNLITGLNVYKVIASHFPVILTRANLPFPDTLPQKIYMKIYHGLNSNSFTFLDEFFHQRQLRI